MPSCYLSAADFATYGVQASTATAAIITASTLVDVYLRRPEGLCYNVDADKAPISMVAMTSPRSFYLASAIQPGQNVTASVAPAQVTVDMIGDVWVLNDASPEAVVIASVPDKATVILQAVKYAHAAGAEAQTDVTLSEQRSMPSKRSITRVSQGPVVSLLSCLGRYGYGRRSDQNSGADTDLNLLAIVNVFGGPPTWNTIPVDQVGCEARTGELWIPSGQLLAYFTEVKISYIAGFQVGGVPAPIKTATAALVANAANAGALAGNLLSVKAGDTAFTRKVSTMLDPDILRQIEPFKAKLFF